MYEIDMRCLMFSYLGFFVSTPFDSMLANYSRIVHENLGYKLESTIGIVNLDFKTSPDLDQLSKAEEYLKIRGH